MTENKKSQKEINAEHVAMLREAFEKGKDEPDITGEFPEYIPLPSEDDEVVAVFIRKIPPFAKKRASMKKAPVFKKKMPAAKKKRPASPKKRSGRV